MARGNITHLEEFRRFAEPYVREHGRFRGNKIAGEAWRARKHEAPMRHERNPDSFGGEALAVGLGVAGAMVGIAVLGGVLDGLMRKKGCRLCGTGGLY